MSIKKLCIVILAFSLTACGEHREPTPIESTDGEAQSWFAEGYIPLAIAEPLPEHPFMAPQGKSAMHSDGYSSDVHPGTGPLGNNIQIKTRVGSRMLGGQCATLTFDSNGDLLSLCTGISGFRIHRLKARSLELLAEYKLPARPSSFQSIVHRDRSIIMEDSSGAYFYLDQKNRIVIADADKIVHRIASRQDDQGNWEFYADASWDLRQHVPDDCMRPTRWFPTGECDLITAVMPDHQGTLWWVTRAGRVGTIDQDNDIIQSMQLSDEEIQNGFSVAEDGVYIVSDHAMYAFNSGAGGVPVIRWRQSYDRGSSRRVGTINQGSGTTPTLLGDRYLTITDNADERMNLLVYNRLESSDASKRLICSVPLFEAGHSVTDNSMIALGRSIVLENNAGFINAYDQTDWSNAGGGIVRVDIREDESGCDIVWQSNERSPSVVPKLSLQNGVAYFYTYDVLDSGVSDEKEIAWFLLGLDFQTGKTLFKIHTGNGKNYNNNWSPITLAPDGTAYIGVSKGIVAIWDEQQTE